MRRSLCPGFWVVAFCLSSLAIAEGPPSAEKAVQPIGIDDGAESPATWKLDITDRRTSRLTAGFQGATGLLHASDFPVRTAVDTRTAATFSASWVPIRFIEIYAAYNANSNANSNSNPVR